MKRFLLKYNSEISVLLITGVARNQTDGNIHNNPSRYDHILCPWELSHIIFLQERLFHWMTHSISSSSHSVCVWIFVSPLITCSEEEAGKPSCAWDEEFNKLSRFSYYFLSKSKNVIPKCNPMFPSEKKNKLSKTIYSLHFKHRTEHECFIWNICRVK